MTARNVTGILSQVNGKPWKDARTGEDIVLHSFQLEGSNQWFRTGTNPIPAGRGQSVKFTADGPNVDLGTFQVVAAVQSLTAPAVATIATPVSPTATAQNATVGPAAPTAGYNKPYAQRSNARGAGAKDAYWEEKAKHDAEKDARYQAVSEPRMALSVAVEAASRVVETALKNDALSFGNAAKAKRVGILSAFVKEIALDLAVFINDAPSQMAAYRAAKANTVESVSGQSNGADEVAE